MPDHWRYLDITKVIMEHLHIKENKHCELVKTRPNRIKFLLDYSKSLNIVEHEGVIFESNLN